MVKIGESDKVLTKDIFGEKPIFVPSFYEYLKDTGEQKVITKLTDTAQVMYTVPDDKEFYVTGITISAVSDAVGARSNIYVYTSSAVRILLGLIIKGANLLAPGITEFSNDIKRDDFVSVLNENNEVLAVGIARHSSDEIPQKQKGMIVKTKHYSAPKHPEILLGGQDWDFVLKANEEILEKREKSVIKYINKIAKRYEDLPKVLSFSGGKDSLALLLIMLKTDLDFNLWLETIRPSL